MREGQPGSGPEKAKSISGTDGGACEGMQAPKIRHLPDRDVAVGGGGVGGEVEIRVEARRAPSAVAHPRHGGDCLGGGSRETRVPRGLGERPKLELERPEFAQHEGPRPQLPLLAVPQLRRQDPRLQIDPVQGEQREPGPVSAVIGPSIRLNAGNSTPGGFAGGLAGSHPGCDLEGPLTPPLERPQQLLPEGGGPFRGASDCRRDGEKGAWGGGDSQSRTRGSLSLSLSLSLSVLTCPGRARPP